MNEPPYLVAPAIPVVPRVTARQVRQSHARRLTDMAKAGGPKDDLVQMRAMFDMLFYASDLTERHPPAALRKLAHIVFRCGDCKGRAIGWIIRIDGRSVFMGEAGNQMISVLALDATGFAAPEFQCRKGIYTLTEEMVRPGTRALNVRLRHSESSMV